MKVCTANSSRFYASQIQRIEQGFVELGHEIIPDIKEADLIYINNPLFDAVLNEKDIRGKKIFNVLDIPHHSLDFDVNTLKLQLEKADAITTISATTARDLEEKTGLKAHVIYNPIMPITREPALTRKLRTAFASFGRRADANKRANLCFHALQLLGFDKSQVYLVGGDGGWGNYLGILSDRDINLVYNSVDFVLVPTRYAGIELPMIEAMAAGVIPVVCNDLWTRKEFLAGFPEYDDVDPNASSIARFIAHFLEDGARMTEFKERLYQHYVLNWEKAFSPKGVAEAILKVYEGTLK